MPNTRVLLITGGYFPAPGGAANYSQILAHLLVTHNVAKIVEVFTERYPGEPRYKLEGSDSRVIVRRSMPWRATRDKKNTWSFLTYIFQLIQIAILIIKEDRRFDIVVLHGSLIYKTGFLARVIGLLRSLRSGLCARYYLDIRDPLIPARIAPLARSFDGVVACARNVVFDLLNKGVPKDLIREIPIPLTPHIKTTTDDRPIYNSFGLSDKRYVFVAHGFTPGKRTEEVVEAVKILREQGLSLCLVVVGRARYWPDNALLAQKEGWLHFLGSLPNNQVRALMENCAIHVNVCTVESIGRASLEAIAAGAITILPPGIPEFEKYCPKWIGTAGNPRRLAEEIMSAISLGEIAPYPLERHQLMTVASQYNDLFYYKSGNIGLDI